MRKLLLRPSVSLCVLVLVNFSVSQSTVSNSIAMANLKYLEELSTRPDEEGIASLKNELERKLDDIKPFDTNSGFVGRSMLLAFPLGLIMFSLS